MENSQLNLNQLQSSLEKIKSEIGKVIVGQHKMIDLLLAAILSNGHVLIEGVPGVAKTLTSKLLSYCINTPFSRIQFTPDLMPSDVIGTSIFNQQLNNFQFRKGPIFSSIVLIDEINRAPAKTQSSLFEVMEERQITYDGVTYPMDYPFMVIATQNPVEHEGTYRLPEAQLDRFLFKINIHYPNLEEEIDILKLANRDTDVEIKTLINTVISKEEIHTYRELVKRVSIEEKVLRLIAQLTNSTRNNGSLTLGASPRASVALLNSSKAFAAMNGRDFVIPDDVLYMLKPVLAHRIDLNPEREMEGATTEDILDEIVRKIEIPR